MSTWTRYPETMREMLSVDVRVFGLRLRFLGEAPEPKKAEGGEVERLRKRVATLEHDAATMNANVNDADKWTGKCERQIEAIGELLGVSECYGPAMLEAVKALQASSAGLVAKFRDHMDGTIGDYRAGLQAAITMTEGHYSRHAQDPAEPFT